MKMKNKILLLTLILPFILVLVVILSIKKNFGEYTDISELHSEEINTFTKSFGFDDFENISAEGFWNINITQADHFEIELIGPENMLKDITMDKTGETLVLSSKKETSSFSPFSKRPKLNITLPLISEMDIKGVASILFSDFNNAETSISVEGVINITGKNCSFDQFSLSGSGVVNASLNVVPVTNADFDYRGIYNISLLINGGSLTGYLDGIGRITASGEISKNAIFVKDPGWLKIIQ